MGIFSIVIKYFFDSVAIASVPLRPVSTNDYSSNLLPILQTIPATANRYSAVAVYNAARTCKFTQELRFRSSGQRPLEWQFGGYYTRVITSSWTQRRPPLFRPTAIMRARTKCRQTAVR
jgi:hypothetical protein